MDEVGKKRKLLAGRRGSHWRRDAGWLVVPMEAGPFGPIIGVVGAR